MDNKIGLEEHFATDDTLLDSKGYLPDRTWTELSRRIVDIADLRLAEMDRNGIAMMVLSLNARAIQAIPDARRADELAQCANDRLAAQIAKRPDRFAGLERKTVFDLAPSLRTQIEVEIGGSQFLAGIDQGHLGQARVKFLSTEAAVPAIRKNGMDPA